MVKQKIRPFLWFDGNAEQAVELYTSLFEDSSVLHVQRSAGGGTGPKGSVFLIEFQLAGLRFTALNGGPQFQFSEAMSLFVECETQAEVDRLWEKLLEGGRAQQCGWLKDRFGVSWQIIPSALGRLMSDPDPEKAQRVVQAMMGMVKIEIAGLERAYAGT